MQKVYCLLLFMIPLLIRAQSVGISNTSITPDASSILELKSTRQGLLIPRMLSTERTAISSPATGLMIYQTEAPAGFYYFDGVAWKEVGASQTSPAVNLRGAITGMVAYAAVKNVIDLEALTFVNNCTYYNRTFIATYPGFYKFDVNLNIYSGTATTMDVVLEINQLYNPYSNLTYVITAKLFQAVTFSDCIKLAAGDRVSVYVKPASFVSVFTGGFFSGFKMN